MSKKGYKIVEICGYVVKQTILTFATRTGSTHTAHELLLDSGGKPFESQTAAVRYVRQRMDKLASAVSRHASANNDAWSERVGSDAAPYMLTRRLRNGVIKTHLWNVIGACEND